MQCFRFFVIGLLCAAASVRAGAAADFDPLRTIPVLDNGRVKPLDSFARERIHAVTGKETFRGPKDPATGKPTGVSGIGSDPVALFLAIVAQPARMKTEPLVLVEDVDLKTALGAPEGISHLSYAAVADQMGDPASDLAKWVAAAGRKRAEGEGSKLTRMERKAEEFVRRWRLLGEALEGAVPAIVAVPGAEERSWLSPAALKSLVESHKKGGEAAFGIGDLPQAYARVQTLLRAGMGKGLGGDPGTAAWFADRYAAFLATRPEGLWSTQGMLRREVLYHRLSLYGWAWKIDLAAFALFLIALVAGGARVRAFAFWTLAVGLLFQLGGFLLRFSVIGFLVGPGEMPRIPLSNLYEALVFVAMGAVGFGIVFERIYRTAHFGLVSSLAGFLCLVAAGSLDFFDSRMGPVEPALRSYWMNYHVSSMLLGYAAGLVSVGISHLYLFSIVRDRRDAVSLARFDLYNYRAMQVASLFIGIGLMLGAVWANESWGRWWGWDPKETWALVTFLAYVLTMHARIVGNLAGFGTAVMGVAAFASIFMTFYGVNLLGKGLHSYGWFEGGWMPLWAFLGVETVFLSVVRFLVGSGSSRPGPDRRDLEAAAPSEAERRVP